MIRSLSVIVMFFLMTACSSDKKTEKSEAVVKEEQAKGIVDQDVIDRLESMGKYLRRLDKFEVSSETTFDIVLENDQKTEFEANFQYKVRRPDKLFAVIKSERKHRLYYYDGSKFTIYSPKEKLYAELSLKGPLSELVGKLNEYGIEVPLADLFAWGTDDSRTKNLDSAIYLNEERKGKESRDHFAIRQDNIDWQVWIRAGKVPLPEKILYEVNTDKAKPKTTSTMKWNTKPSFGDNVFEFKPPKGSMKISIVPARKPQEE